MKIQEQLTKDLRIEFDSEIPRFAFYTYDGEITSSTIEPLRTNLINFLKTTKKVIK